MNPSPNFAYSSKEEIIKTLSIVLNWVDDMQQVIGDLAEKLGLSDQIDSSCPAQEAWREIETVYRDIKYKDKDPDRSQIRSMLKHYQKLICVRIWELEDQAEAALN